MRKIVYMTAFAGAMVVGANAALISNGDWESTASVWKSTDSTALSDWTSSLWPTLTDGAYVEPIDGYGSAMVGALKAVTDNYYQQNLVGVDAGIGEITVNYDGGIRYHSTYPSTARDVYLRVSLWNATTDTELAGVDIATAYSASATSLSARSHVLTYDPSGLAGDTLAVRFANTTTDHGALVGTTHSNTVLMDNIDVIPEPATLGLIALFGGGIFFVRRKLAM